MFKGDDYRDYLSCDGLKIVLYLNLTHETSIFDISFLSLCF